MKKFILTLLAVLALFGITVMAADVQQPQESWYDWSKRHARNVGHYVPSWHYWPAVGAGLVGGVSGAAMRLGYPYIFGTTSAGFKAIPNTNFLVLLLAIVPSLVAAGWTIKQIEQFIFESCLGLVSYPKGGSYKYYLPGMVAGLSPWAIIAILSWLANKSFLDLDDDKVNKLVLEPLYTAAGAGMLTSPLLLGAGHLAHQYFNPPVQAPVVPVLPQQLEEQMQQLQNVEQPAEIEGILK